MMPVVVEDERHIMKIEVPEKRIKTLPFFEVSDLENIAQPFGELIELCGSELFSKTNLTITNVFLYNVESHNDNFCKIRLFFRESGI